MLTGSTNRRTPFDSNSWSPTPPRFLDHQAVLEARAAAALHEHAQAAFGLALFVQQLADLARRRLGHVDERGVGENRRFRSNRLGFHDFLFYQLRPP